MLEQSAGECTQRPKSRPGLGTDTANAVSLPHHAVRVHLSYVNPDGHSNSGWMQQEVRGALTWRCAPAIVAQLQAVA